MSANHCYECDDLGCCPVCGDDRWKDLRERLERAGDYLLDLADEEGVRASDRDRLEGKVEGVLLALGYMRDWERRFPARAFDFGGSPSQVDVETKGRT